MNVFEMNLFNIDVSKTFVLFLGLEERAKALIDKVKGDRSLHKIERDDIKRDKTINREIVSILFDKSGPKQYIVKEKKFSQMHFVTFGDAVFEKHFSSSDEGAMRLNELRRNVFIWNEL